MRSIEKMLGLFLGGWELVMLGQGVEVGGGKVLNTLQKIILRTAKRVLTMLI